MLSYFFQKEIRYIGVLALWRSGEAIFYKISFCKLQISFKFLDVAVCIGYLFLNLTDLILFLFSIFLKIGTRIVSLLFKDIKIALLNSRVKDGRKKGGHISQKLLTMSEILRCTAASLMSNF